MIENIAHNKYSEVIDSYTALNVSSSIRGDLLEKDGKSLKIDIGNNKALDIELREDIDIKKGETVLIDRRNILKSKVVDLDEVKIENSDVDTYTNMLKKLDIEVTEENIKILKKFDDYEIDLTKENFEVYTLAKNSLNSISSNLDYEAAIRLTDMDVDIENISVDMLSSLVENLEEEKQGFKILDLFKKKELTTEEAEEIAKEIYGSKMGKDITDIIKSLHKRKVSLTKKNIEKINDVFYKLDKLSDIEDKTFVDTIKNKLDINIDNLYKVKRYVKDEGVKVETKQASAPKVIDIKNYETPVEMKKVTERDLKFLEEDIKDLIENLELEVSEETLKLSKEFIIRDMEVTRENIETIEEMKVALEYIIKNADKEVASQLVKENIDIETTDLRVIADKIDLIKNQEVILDETETKPVQVIEVKEKIDINTNNINLNQDEPKIIDNLNKPKVNKKTNETENLSIKPITVEKNTNEIMSKIENLKKVEEKDILTLLEKNIDFKINKIEQVIFKKREVVSFENFKDITYSEPSTLQMSALNEVKKISTAFNEIGKLDLNTIAFQIKRNIPISISTIQKSNKFIASDKDITTKDYRVVENIDTQAVSSTFNKNGLESTRANVQKTMEAFRSYENIKENLTSNIVKQAVNENIKLDKMDINLASRYVNEYKGLSLNHSFQKQVDNSREIEKFAQMFTDHTRNIAQNSDKNIMFLMKNNKSFSFKDLKDADFLFRNKEQLGHKISELDDVVEESGNQIIKEKMESLKKEIVDISKNFGKSREDLDKSNKSIEEKVKDIEESISRLNQEHTELLNNKTKEVAEKLDENKNLAKENKIIQMPFYMNGQFTNLNMYFRDKQREGKNKDSKETSVVISIDTINMGNVNINLDIFNKEIDVKIGLESLEDKKHIENYKPILKEFLEKDDYKLKNIEFFKEGDKDSFIREDRPDKKSSVVNGNLDIKV